MEPFIKLDTNISVPFIDYKTCLSNKIKFVCSKVHFSYEGITWIIFDPSISDIRGNKPNQIQKILVGNKGIDYGATNGIDTIWISTLSIRKEYISCYRLNNKLLYPDLLSSTNTDFLADVILDEIAHIATGYDHGTPKYDQKLLSLRNTYYSNSGNRVLISNIAKSTLFSKFYNYNIINR